MPAKSSVIVAALLLLAASCSKPASYEQFIRRDAAPEGVYGFELDFSDSTALYDLSFYAPAVKRDTMLALDVLWSCPGADSLQERVYLPMKGREVIELYRSDAAPAPAGIWKLSVKVDGAPEDFLGIGIICKRHGTRQTP